MLLPSFKPEAFKILTHARCWVWVCVRAGARCAAKRRGPTSVQGGGGGVSKSPLFDMMRPATAVLCSPDMKATITYVSALVLPLPAYTFVPPLASTKTRHRITRPRFQARTNVCYGKKSSLRPLTPATAAVHHVMTHAVSLSNTVGGGESIPAATTHQDAPASPALNRSNLGVHLKIGSKVINL